MNLGDGLKLETEILDGKPRLILASYGGKKPRNELPIQMSRVPESPGKQPQNSHTTETSSKWTGEQVTLYNKIVLDAGTILKAILQKNNNKKITGASKPALKMGNKSRVANHALRIRHTEHVPRSTQNALFKHESLTKPRSSSSLSMTRGEKLLVTANNSSHEAPTKDNSLIFQRDDTGRMLHSENLNVKKSKQKPQNAHTSAEDLRKSLVCLTQEQLEQILMSVKEGTRSVSEVHNEKQEETATDRTSEENTITALQKAGEDSSVPDAASSDLSRKQEVYPQPGQKVVIKNSWKPADIFSTLGEREGDKALLELKKTQWKKELDEQVALKKKLKETLEGEVTDFWKRPGSDKTSSEKMRTADPDKEASLQEQPLSAMKHEQQKEWSEELDEQKEEVKLQKEKLIISKAEEHDRWAMHFDSLKSHLDANAQHPLNGVYKKQPEILCPSPDPKELTAFIHPFSPAALGNLMPSKVGNDEKTAKNSPVEHSQKVSFLRSMTALLDPAQIEERDRRRQKQLEHQKAIMAQVEEKRKKKQLEEEQRKWEEQEEEQRLARERELMQKQFEEDMLKQKQKEEIMTLKTNELYQTMQKAQELAQRLKQEQRIRDLAQKGHDISKLQKNLGSGDNVFENYNTGISHQSHNFSNDINCKIDQQTSPRKDTAVQTDDFIMSTYTASAEERTKCCGSPDISIEYKERSNSKKCHKEMLCRDKNKIAEKENDGIYNDLCEQFARKERQAKSMEKCGKRPDWNINKPGKRYIPASERYPKQLQKQREENKVRRQMELLQLVERNTPGNLCQKKGSSSERSPSPHQEMSRKNKGHTVHEEEQLHNNHLNEERSESPPVPAVKNRLHQGQQKQIHTSNFLVLNNSSRRDKSTHVDTQQRRSPAPLTGPGRPPSSHFVPYVRTDEVYYLDPAAPVTRPSTHEPQFQQFNDSYPASRQILSSDHVRDPLLNPDVVKSRERQQAILKGLSELRQGLLQKQKELETSLIPVIAQEENFISPF